MIYLYGIARAADVPREALPWPAGIEGQPVTVMLTSSFAAVISRVAAEAFAEPQVEPRNLDLAWLAPRVIAHQNVVERACQWASFVPAAFATLFSGDTALESYLSREESRFRALLDDLQGQEEWGVKVVLDREAAKAEKLAARKPAWSGLPPGLQYLAERKAVLAIDQELNTEAGERLTALCRLVETMGARSAPALSPDAVSLLLPRSRFALLCELARRFESAGVRLELTGPFPPYSFVRNRAAAAA